MTEKFTKLKIDILWVGFRDLTVENSGNFFKEGVDLLGQKSNNIF